jgi:hypothetical protein
MSELVFTVTHLNCWCACLCDCENSYAQKTKSADVRDVNNYPSLDAIRRLLGAEGCKMLLTLIDVCSAVLCVVVVVVVVVVMCGTGSFESLRWRVAVRRVRCTCATFDLVVERQVAVYHCQHDGTARADVCHNFAMRRARAAVTREVGVVCRWCDSIDVPCAKSSCYKMILTVTALLFSSVVCNPISFSTLRATPTFATWRSLIVAM